MSPWIKICGNTRVEDCIHAASCGADAVGFVFAPGKRTVTVQQIAPLTKQLPESLEKIGVFTDSDSETLVCTALQAGLTGLQLHRAYNPPLIHSVKDRARFAGCSLKLIQVVMWDITEELSTQTDTLRALCERIERDALVDRIMIDSCIRHDSGGTGIQFDWWAAQTALINLKLPVVAAGGLRPENVTEAMRILNPFGVDVSSGVEDLPGVKNSADVLAFIQNAHGHPRQQQRFALCG